MTKTEGPTQNQGLNVSQTEKTIAMGILQIYIVRTNGKGP